MKNGFDLIGKKEEEEGAIVGEKQIRFHCKKKEEEGRANKVRSQNTGFDFRKKKEKVERR